MRCYIYAVVSCFVFKYTNSCLSSLSPPIEEKPENDVCEIMYSTYYDESYETVKMFDTVKVNSDLSVNAGDVMEFQCNCTQMENTDIRWTYYVGKKIQGTGSNNKLRIIVEAFDKGAGVSCKINKIQIKLNIDKDFSPNDLCEYGYTTDVKDFKCKNDSGLPTVNRYELLPDGSIWDNITDGSGASALFCLSWTQVDSYMQRVIFNKKIINNSSYQNGDCVPGTQSSGSSLPWFATLTAGVLVITIALILVKWKYGRVKQETQAVVYAQLSLPETARNDFNKVEEPYATIIGVIERRMNT